MIALATIAASPRAVYHAEMAHLIELDGCLNFRDLGGYPTTDGRRLRRGRLYRSDALHHMSETDVRVVRDELGVRDVIDLRSSAEIALDGRGPLAVAPFTYHHLPLFNEEANGAGGRIPEDLGEQYFLLLQVAREPISRILEIFARAKGAALFHCAAGKDRTGVISAVVLGLLGVAESDIVEDYVFTSRNLDQIVARLKRSESYRNVFEQLPPSTLHAEPETMTGFLERVRQAFGSMAAYARETGVAEATLGTLASSLLEGP